GAVLWSIRRAELEGRVLFEAVDVEFGAHVVAHAFLLANALPQSRVSGVAEYRRRDTHRRIVGAQVVQGQRDLAHERGIRLVRRLQRQGPRGFRDQGLGDPRERLHALPGPEELTQQRLDGVGIEVADDRDLRRVAARKLGVKTLDVV